jgi:Fe-S cluster assembly iron-binding protein IscA
MGMALDEPEENEQPVNINGIDVLIADGIRPFVDSKTVDYIKHNFIEELVITGSGDTC